jgi:regulator of protease activity HflC (stomatin/prohibitin superfamily)
MSMIAILILVVGLVGSAVRILREYERAVVFRLGRVLDGTKGPGLIFLIPLIDKAERVDLRVITMDVPSQDVITRDNVSVKVNAVVYFRILDPQRATIEVEDVYYATSQLAQTTLRSICGEAELDELLAEREKINQRIQDILDRHTDPWGVKVSMVELKHIDLPGEMQRAMAKQAEAERERRAKIIAAEGEFQAAQKLADASEIMAKEPMTLQLRYMQTLVEVAGDKNSTILFPLPMDLITPFLKAPGDKG